MMPDSLIIEEIKHYASFGTSLGTVAPATQLKESYLCVPHSLCG